MTLYLHYYNNQLGCGAGGGGGGIRRVFRGSTYQRGRGVGSWLGGIFRGILPYLKSGAKAVGKEALRAGINVFDDVAHNNVKFGDAVKGRVGESSRNLKRKAAEKISNIMKGSGYKTTTVAKRKRQSRKTRATRRVATTSIAVTRKKRGRAGVSTRAATRKFVRTKARKRIGGGGGGGGGSSGGGGTRKTTQSRRRRKKKKTTSALRSITDIFGPK